MTDAPRPGIDEQLAAIELLVINHAGHVDILRSLVEKGRRSKEELHMSAQYLPAAQQAVVTLRFVRDHADEVRALAAKHKEQT